MFTNILHHHHPFFSATTSRWRCRMYKF